MMKQLLKRAETELVLIVPSKWATDFLSKTLKRNLKCPVVEEEYVSHIPSQLLVSENEDRDFKGFIFDHNSTPHDTTQKRSCRFVENASLRHETVSLSALTSVTRHDPKDRALFLHFSIHFLLRQTPKRWA